MRKIEFDDVLNIAEYEKIRSESRKKIIGIKNKRRISVGPLITYLFENFDTMLYQIQEMMRAERLVYEKDIAQEIEIYNELVPGLNELTASLLIEIDNRQTRNELLPKLVGLPGNTFITINSNKILAEFDPRQGSPERLSSVQYVKFKIPTEDVQKFNDKNSHIILSFTHKNYSYDYELKPEEKSIFYKDLTTKER